jgi:hypothetical protein
VTRADGLTVNHDLLDETGEFASRDDIFSRSTDNIAVTGPIHAMKSNAGLATSFEPFLYEYFLPSCSSAWRAKRRPSRSSASCQSFLHRKVVSPFGADG